MPHCRVCGFQISGKGRRYCSTLCRNPAEKERLRARGRKRKRNPGYWQRKWRRKSARRSAAARAKRQADPAWQQWRVEVNARKIAKQQAHQRYVDRQAILALKPPKPPPQKWTQNAEYQTARRAYRWKKYKGTPGYLTKRQHDRERSAKVRDIFRGLQEIGLVDKNEILAERPPPKVPKPPKPKPSKRLWRALRRQQRAISGTPAVAGAIFLVDLAGIARRVVVDRREFKNGRWRRYYDQHARKRPLRVRFAAKKAPPRVRSAAEKARRNANLRKTRTKRREIINALRERGWLNGLDIIAVPDN